MSAPLRFPGLSVKETAAVDKELSKPPGPPTASEDLPSITEVSNQLPTVMGDFLGLQYTIRDGTPNATAIEVLENLVLTHFLILVSLRSPFRRSANPEVFYR